MRKMMKTAIAALLLGGTALKPALAQNCTSPTRCDELGYKKSAADCDGMESLVCPFDSSKYFCLETQIEVGMILYSDGTVSDSVIPSKTPVGIVAYVSGLTRLAIALEESSSTLRWSIPDYEDLSCLRNIGTIEDAEKDLNGPDNTSCIINYSSSNSYPAAEYCHSYKPVSSGTGSSGWYLPAAGELYEMHFNYRAINSGLQKLSKTQILDNYCYWSSSEHDEKGVWEVAPIGGAMSTDYYGNKDMPKCGNTHTSKGHTRCFLAF